MKLLKLSLVLISIGCLTGVPALAGSDTPVTKFDKPPVPVRTPPPEYPRTLTGTSGMVSMILIVDDDGSVLEAVVSKSTQAEFEQPALDAVRKWKFTPAVLNGQPVKAKISVPVRFTG